MAMSPVVIFNGNATEAFHFYEATFRGKIAFLMSWGSSPMAGQVPPDWQDKILYGRMAIGDSQLIGGDGAPGAYKQPQGISLQYNPVNVEDSQRIFAALAEGGSVTLPLQQTF